MSADGACTQCSGCFQPADVCLKWIGSSVLWRGLPGSLSEAAIFDQLPGVHLVHGYVAFVRRACIAYGDGGLALDSSPGPGSGADLSPHRGRDQAGDADPCAAIEARQASTDRGTRPQ